MIRRITPHTPLLLCILALAFLTASVWTIGRTELGTTLGLAATGAALLILEWRTTS